MQEKAQNLAQHVGICGRLYNFFIAIFTARRLASGFSDSSSSHTEDSESEDEFWEAEDTTTSDESNETSEELLPGARQAALQKGKEKMSQTEANSRRELRLVQEFGMYDGTSLSLVQEKTNYRISAKKYPVGREPSSANNGARAREATRWQTKGSPEMMKRRHSMKTKIPKERSEEVGVKTRKARILSRVFTNINEKSDAFIRSRREAMRRSYSVGSKLF